ncbi:MAG: alpha-amylase, partial [Allobaculum sp.]|nr:alpha-amylase [Allobaculum sp.]
KGTVRTKYGTAKQYKAAIDACHKASIQVIADIVLNHRMGGDEEEVVLVRNVDPQNRTTFISAPYATKIYTRFLFANRKGKYSSLLWDASFF